MAHGTITRILAACTVSAALVFSTAASAQDAPAADKPNEKVEVVRITALSGIKPETAAIAKGTTVVWVNQLARDIEIRFTAKQVTRACLSPTNFFTTRDGLFQSKKIPPQGVASLCFIENGRYDYVVYPAGDPGTEPPKPLQGTVLIKY